MNRRTSALFLATCIGTVTPAVLADEHTVSGGQPIQPVIDAANDGDIIYVEAGDYDGSLNFRGRAITLQSVDGPEETTLTSTVVPSSVIVLDSGEQRDTLIKGFTITGGTGTPGGNETVGGGFRMFGASPTIQDCIIRNNRASNGGGMYLLASYPRIVDCSFLDNESTGAGNDNGGGAIYSSSCSPQIVSCEFRRNLASGSGHGGGIMTNGGFPLFVNNEFIANEAHIGGAVEANHGGPSFVNCTFARNVARDYTAVIHGKFGDTVVTVANSILWDNVSPYDYPVYGTGGATILINRSNIDFSWAGVGNMSDDPKFRDSDGGDFQLTAESPCLDRGDSLVLPNDFADLDLDFDFIEPLPVDRSFLSRIQGDGIDLGAFEFQGQAPDDPVGCPSDVDGNEVVDVHDLLDLLSMWGLCDGCPGDADDNGVIDVFDLINLLESWGACQP